MAVKLRLTRIGKKKRPFYRIVAIDSRKPRGGRFIEKLGYYNPLSDPIDFKIDEQRALYWLQTGAIPTPTVKSLLSKQGLLLKLDMMRRGFEPARIEEEMKKWEVLQIEKKRRLQQAKQVKAEEKAPVEADAEVTTPTEKIEELQEPEAPEVKDKPQETTDVQTEEASENESTSNNPTEE